MKWIIMTYSSQGDSCSFTGGSNENVAPEIFDEIIYRSYESKSVWFQKNGRESVIDVSMWYMAVLRAIYSLSKKTWWFFFIRRTKSKFHAAIYAAANKKIDDIKTLLWERLEMFSVTR